MNDFGDIIAGHGIAHLDLNAWAYVGGACAGLRTAAAHRGDCYEDTDTDVFWSRHGLLPLLLALEYRVHPCRIHRRRVPERQRYRRVGRIIQRAPEWRPHLHQHAGGHGLHWGRNADPVTAL